MIKIALTKLCHPTSFSGPLISLVSPFTEITMDRGAKLRIGKNFKMRDGAKLRVRKGATCIIGNNSSINCNNIIACRERIEIGENVMLSPNVLIYDHDHDFRAPGGVKAGKYKTAPVKIGNNVWIGANTVILRGTEIGDNCVIGAGGIVKGQYEEGSVIIQKRNEDVE
ncbi:MAG: acyltransferase [Ruminococcus sp.]|nr:acyltransferase [Ruminococcus sp.]